MFSRVVGGFRFGAAGWYPQCWAHGRMNANFRLIQPTDFEKLMRFYVHFVPKQSFHEMPPDTHSGIVEWLRDLDRKGCVQFVVEAGDRIAAHAWLEPAPSGDEGSFSVFVHQDFRGLGIGRNLSLGVLNHGCKQMHLKRVLIRIDNSNPIAQQTLERFGFYARDLNSTFARELEMERPSSCEKCKGERCIIFNKPIPFSIALPPGAGVSRANWVRPYVQRSLKA